MSTPTATPPQAPELPNEKVLFHAAKIAMAKAETAKADAARADAAKAGAGAGEVWIVDDLGQRLGDGDEN
jgi:hypothetical protein